MPHVGRRLQQNGWIGARSGFTLVELLVSIGVILLLIAMLFPILSSTRARANGVVCQSHLGTLWQGWLAFASDHDNRLPGTLYNFWAGDTDPDHQDWMSGGGVGQGQDGWSVAPQKGTVFKYINDYQVYRCPALVDSQITQYNQGPGFGGTGSDNRGDSNGRFDYVAFTTFNGAHLYNVPLTATFTNPYTGEQTICPTPVICEENAETLDGYLMYGDFGYEDRLARHHWGGSNYVSPDGAVHWFKPMDGNAYFDPPPPGNSGSLCWTVTTRRGNVINMGASLHPYPPEDANAPVWGTWGQFDSH